MQRPSFISLKTSTPKQLRSRNANKHDFSNVSHFISRNASSYCSLVSGVTILMIWFKSTAVGSSSPLPSASSHSLWTAPIQYRLSSYCDSREGRVRSGLTRNSHCTTSRLCTSWRSCMRHNYRCRGRMCWTFDTYDTSAHYLRTDRDVRLFLKLQN